MGRPGGGCTNRVTLAALAAGGSLLVSALCFLAGFTFFFLFLFFPLVPILTRERRRYRCPVCGYLGDETRRFCPYDGTPLRQEES